MLIACNNKSVKQKRFALLVSPAQHLGSFYTHNFELQIPDRLSPLCFMRLYPLSMSFYVGVKSCQLGGKYFMSLTFFFFYYGCLIV